MMGEVFLTGSAGLIEGVYYGHSNKQSAGRQHLGNPTNLVLILPPNPQRGGTMNNRVTYHLHRKFVEHEFFALRINFRGVGRSGGEIPKNSKDLQDAVLQDSAAAMKWLINKVPNVGEVWIAGYSIGSWAALQHVMRNPRIEGFVGVGLPVRQYDFNFLIPCPTPGLIVHPENDSITEESEVSRLVGEFNRYKKEHVEYRVAPNADHFFSDSIPGLLDIVDLYLSARRENSSSAGPVPRVRERKRRRNTQKVRFES